MTLYIDVDDTLLLYFDKDGRPLAGAHPYGSGDSVAEARINEALRDAVIEWMSLNKDIPVVVWSGGGALYSGEWRKKIFPTTKPIFSLSKDLRLPVKGDVCVDDLELPIKTPCITWQYFTEWVYGVR